MPKYDVGIILRADLSDDEINEQHEQINEWIEGNGGKSTSVDRQGRRRLAYPINKQRDGYYTYIKAEMPSSVPAIIERNIRLSESFLRFLIIRDESTETSA